jgi:lysine 2,3-aminomutase
LSAVNDTADEIHQLAYACRSIGIEFHHVYVAGLPLQKKWSESRPVDISDVIDIATRVRKDGSGREIPRYIILTELGEVDFGLNGKMSGEDGRVSVKLLPYSLEYYQGMDSDYKWPDHVKTDTDGKPIIQVAGLRNTTSFFIS